jgi:hypothetical protein
MLGAYEPDRIPTGEEAKYWLPFIRNEKETSENNWCYCVKQLSNNDIKPKHYVDIWMDARGRENDLLSMTSCWLELDTVYQKYLRTFST